jgi:hypothetical protein
LQEANPSHHRTNLQKVVVTYPSFLHSKFIL